MSQISLKSISGITSITTPAGVDNVFTVHTNDTTEKFRVDQTGNLNISGIITATTLSGSGSSLTNLPSSQLTGDLPAISGASLTNLNASNIASGTVPTARLGSGTANNTTFLRGDSTFQTVNTDLVSDSSPQLGGLLDGNGNTANFTANNTGLGLPIGTDANEPTASAYKGYIRFNDDDDEVYFSNGTVWKKINSITVTLSSVTGTIYAGSGTNLTLAGTGFLSSGLVFFDTPTNAGRSNLSLIVNPF